MVPIVIAHRGASAERPEHTLAAYRLAIAAGADYIEPDLVSTRDGVLVARHENEIGGTTNVADFPEFGDRRTRKRIDGKTISGWFTEDFTFEELRRLRARERIPKLRPHNVAYLDEPIPSFEEILALARTEGEKRNHPVGVYPETKHPGYFRQLGLPLEPPLLAALERAGLTTRNAPVFIQSFEVGNLVWLRRHTDVRLVQLLSRLGRPADQESLRYRQMASRKGLAQIAGYANAIGPDKTMLFRQVSGQPTPLVKHAHQAGLLVHPWTFRPENFFLPRRFRGEGSPADHGDLTRQIGEYLALGIDGLFCDSPGIAVAAVCHAQREMISSA